MLLHEVAAGKLPQNFQFLTMQMSLPDFARLQYITTYMHESCEIIYVVVGTSCNRNLMYRNEWMAFFTWMKSPSESLSESLSDRVRSITSHLAILQHPKLTD